MSAPELDPIEKAFFNVLQRVIADGLAEAEKLPSFIRLSPAERVEVRRRLLALASLHAAIKRGDEFPSHLISIPRLRGWLPAYLEALLFHLVPDFGVAKKSPAIVRTSVHRCQVVDPLVRLAFQSCTEIGDAGLMCEASGHGEHHDVHALSDHTSLHAQVGVNHSCDAVDAMLREAENRTS